MNSHRKSHTHSEEKSERVCLANAQENSVMNKASVQHAVKNIARKVLNLNNITFNKRRSGLTGLSSEMRNDFLPPPLATRL